MRMDWIHTKQWKLTLNNLYDRYISQKYNLKPTTKGNYIYMYNHFVRDTLGKRKPVEIRHSDIKEFYYTILEKQEMKANTLDNVHINYIPLDMAVRDGLIRMNPTDGVMTEIKKASCGMLQRDMHLPFRSRRLL